MLAGWVVERENGGGRKRGGGRMTEGEAAEVRDNVKAGKG